MHQEGFAIGRFGEGQGENKLSLQEKRKYTVGEFAQQDFRFLYF